MSAFFARSPHDDGNDDGKDKKQAYSERTNETEDAKTEEEAEITTKTTNILFGYFPIWKWESEKKRHDEQNCLCMHVSLDSISYPRFGGAMLCL